MVSKHEHKWPSLPSFKGQTSQQKVPIIMTWENGLYSVKFGPKTPVFFRIHIVLTQEQQYTHLWGRRRLSWCCRCLGGRHHGDDERPRVSTWYWFGRSALWPNQYQVEMRRKSCTWDILWIAAASCLWKIWVDQGRGHESLFLKPSSKFLKCDCGSSTFATDHLELEWNKKTLIQVGRLIFKSATSH